jgi:hypothetical protein
MRHEHGERGVAVVGFTMIRDGGGMRAGAVLNWMDWP